MALLNRVGVRTATTGTGTVTLGTAIDGYCTFSEAGATNASAYTYLIQQADDFELGTGVYTAAGTTLTRATVSLSKIGGVAGTTKISLDGTATVFVVAAVADFPSVGGVPDGDKGDITVSGSGTAWAIDNDVVSNAQAANMANATIKGRASAGAGDPEDLTGAQATALLSEFTGDSGAGGVKGLVPAPAAGDAAAGKVLYADRTWAVPPGASGGEANTASNVGTAGVGVFKNKVGLDLRFKKVNAGSNKITITDDTANDEIDIDVAQANLVIDLSGSQATGTLAAGRFPALTGDVTTTAGNLATTVANSAVTYAKIQNVSATSRVLGRITAAAGVVEELTGANIATIIGSASTTATGVVELATDAETQTGTDTARAITPANLTAKEATTANYLANTADRLLTTDQVWASGALTALTDGATITPDFSLGFNFSVTLAGNRTLANPTNTKVGQTGCIVVTQDATGSRTLAYGTNWEFAGGTAVVLTTTANAKDILYYWVQSSTSIIITGIQKALA